MTIFTKLGSNYFVENNLHRDSHAHIINDYNANNQFTIYSKDFIANAGNGDMENYENLKKAVNYLNTFGDVAIARWSSPKSLSYLERSPAPFAVGCA